MDAESEDLLDEDNTISIDVLLIALEAYIEARVGALHDEPLHQRSYHHV
jgi:hypothetical protein